MDKKKPCPAGLEWSNVVNVCVSFGTETKPEPVPPTELPLTNGDSVTVLSQALWVSVLLATLGSILALAIWFIIYKRQSRLSSTPEDAEQQQQQQQERLQQTEPAPIIHPLPSESSADMFPPCHQPHLGAHTGSGWGKEDRCTACRDCAKHAGTTEAGGGRPECRTVREHKIPLPATELGGTALVTTKTV